jgi:hypothetical protein
MTGPFESEREARELPAVQAIYRAFRADPGVGRMAPHNHKMLITACVEASVELGAYDPPHPAVAVRLGAGDMRRDRRADHPRA